jgi:hypothetical protein
MVVAWQLHHVSCHGGQEHPEDDVAEVLHLSLLALWKNNTKKKERGKLLADPAQEGKEGVPEQ